MSRHTHGVKTNLVSPSLHVPRETHVPSLITSYKFIHKIQSLTQPFSELSSQITSKGLLKVLVLLEVITTGKNILDKNKII